MDQSYDIARSQAQPFVNGLVHAVVGLANQVGNMVSIPVDDIECTIGRASIDHEITENDIVDGKYILVQRGKKNYFIINVL